MGKFVKNQYFAMGPCERCCHPELDWYHIQTINHKKIELFQPKSIPLDHGIWYTGAASKVKNSLPINFIEISRLWNYYLFPYTTGLVRARDLLLLNGEITLNSAKGKFADLVDTYTFEDYPDKDDWNESEIIKAKNVKICKEQIFLFMKVDFEGDPYLCK